MLKIIIIFIVISFLSYSCSTFSLPILNKEKTYNYDGESFLNIDGKRKVDIFEVLTWLLTHERGFWPDYYDFDNSDNLPIERVKDGELNVYFINHATVLIQFDGINVLTDPLWFDVTSPIPPIGPRKRRLPGIKFENLPEIDLVILSHCHYDHFDIRTLRKLKEKFNPIMLFPIGNESLMEENNFDNSFAMDWWDTFLFKNVNISFVPARHFANRGAEDRNRSLWGGYVLESSGGPIYFAGDTGFGVHYELISNKFGDMRFCMFPIAPILPRWFMREVHQDASEAVLAHKLLNSKKSMPIHFGTFQQAEDSHTYAINMLIESIYNQGINPEEFVIPMLGKFIEVPKLSKYK